MNGPALFGAVLVGLSSGFAGGGLAVCLPALAPRRIFGVIALATAAWILFR
jgi:hypothetical protein